MDKLAKIYIDEMVSCHGVLLSIVSDWYSWFTSKFWDGQQKELGTRVKLSMTCHPQTDDRSDRMIQTLEDMLRSYVIDFEGNWDSHLPPVEFTYNNIYHSSIGMAPFEALYGRKCRTPETADKVKGIRVRLRAARDRQKSYANKKRRPIEFQVGERDMLKVSPWKGIIRFGKRRNLSPRFLGPFTILERIGLQAYRCLAKKDSIIQLTEIRVDNGNRCVEELEANLESKTKKLRNKDVTMVKVQWRHHRGANVTWESNKSSNVSSLRDVAHESEHQGSSDVAVKKV
ncbi:hypothetical protein L6452_43759 [Arctium lappa]|uniref:Uncharacterized protein n=1 Tax=Arctium lappa TaxID=4217 RepID=A0ACB8XFN2_ARCLA|nr:hypothetical protein L6452_43759 [Arctium lappa]